MVIDDQPLVLPLAGADDQTAALWAMILPVVCSSSRRPIARPRRVAEAAVVESEEVRPGIVLDYDAEGRVVAVEIIDASEHLSTGADLWSLTGA